MSIATQKKIYWAMLAASSGWLLYLPVNWFQHGSPSSYEIPTIILFSFASVMGLIVSIYRLRECYRSDPTPMLRIATQKKICWLLAAMSMGWLIIIAIVCTQERISQREFIPLSVWTAVCGMALLGSIMVLRRCYRLEPAAKTGHWHISLADIYVATFFAAFCMMLWQAFWPQNFLYWGAALSIIAGIWLLCSLLLAERRGFQRFQTKVPMAFAMAFKSYGLLALGAIVSICILILFMDGPHEPSKFLYELTGLKYLRTGYDNIGNEWLGISLRLGMISCIIGTLMTRLLRDRR